MTYYGGGMGYYDGNSYNEEPDEYEVEEEPQPRQRQSGGQGLRNYAQRVDRENQDLKRRLAMLEEANRDLLGDSSHSPGYAPQNGPQAGGNPHSPILTAEEQQQYSRLLAQGAMPAAPSGSDAEQIARIRNAESPEALMAYLRSQGNTLGTQSYNGQGW